MRDGSADEGTLLREALDTLALPVCVLDSAGVVRMTTRSWGQRAPGGPHAARASFNLLRALEHAAAAGDVHARLVHDGLVSVLAGRAAQFRLEYPVDAERGEWQLLLAAALASGGAVLTHTDVTARRAAEARLRRLSRRYDTATAAAAVAVWELELSSMSVAIDAVLCRILGYPVTQPQEWADWRARVHADDIAVVDAVWQASCSPVAGAVGERAFGPFEVRLADAHGGYRCFECAGKVIADRQGRATRAHGTLHEVTDRRVAQEALQRSNAHLQALAKRLAVQEE